MKTISNIFLLLGLITLCIMTVAMFGSLREYISDKTFLMLLPVGISMCMIGFMLNELTIKPISRAQFTRKKQLVRYCVYSILSCIVLSVLISFV